jgi:uncharacterized protein
MAKNVIVNAGFLVAPLSSRDGHHLWAAAQAPDLPPPWSTSEPVLSEAFHLLGNRGQSALAALLRRGALLLSFADACLVRMTETLSDPVILTTDSDFRVYRRHGRRVIPCVTPE